MGYSTRPYSLSSLSPGRLQNGVKWLLIVNCAIFVISFYSRAAEALLRHFALMPRAVVETGAIWQLFTYQFLHDSSGFGHILVNMLTLWMFGVTLEQTWGTRKFLQYYFLCAVGAGVCVVLGEYLLGNPWNITIGASGAIYGLLLAFGVLFPDAMLLFFFLFPIKAKYYVMIVGLIAFMSSTGAAGSGVSHLAHLGGMLFGLLYLKGRLANRRTDWIGTLQRRYQTWKFERNKRKFQVYMRQRHSDRDRRTH
jgi:membrane associated rhomboid family serine protease